MSSVLDDLRLRGKRVLLERIVVKEVGGIVMPDNKVQANDQDDNFIVLAVGDKVEQEEIKVGATVFLAGNTYQLLSNEDNKPIYMSLEEHILAEVIKE